jgi:hypothetical protein
MADNSQKTPFNRSINLFAQAKVSQAIGNTGRSLPCSVVSFTKGGPPIVTVKFEVEGPYTLPNVTVPIFGPEYIRYPIQVGDKGMVVASDAYLGGMSGLGDGVASLDQLENLTALFFMPLGNKNWASSRSDAVTIHGPQGVTIEDTGKNCTVVLDTSNIVETAKSTVKLVVGSTTLTVSSPSVQVVVGGTTMTVSATGVAIVGNLTVTGNMTITGTGGGGTINVNGSLVATGNLTAGSGGAGSVELLSHRHSASGGTGTGGPPVPGS